MRLHRLAVTAFGPFGGTQHVDFDALSDAGLFLLHGATGAGKTSVLDAVCYALYGGVPGARQQPGAGLRSDHAGDRTRTEVLLELTVGGRRLEITRRPEQDRPKRRGTGYTRDRAQTWLREYDGGKGEWRALSRSHQEVGEEVGQLTGMSREQFCQVVLLPQGDFARFLRAGAEERAKLLGRLFDTGRFAAAEEHLARLRRAAQEELRAGDETLLGLAHRMRQAAGPGHGLGDPAGGFGDVLPGGEGTVSRGSTGAGGRAGAGAVAEGRGGDPGGAAVPAGRAGTGTPGTSGAAGGEGEVSTEGGDWGPASSGVGGAEGSGDGSGRYGGAEGPGDAPGTPEGTARGAEGPGTGPHVGSRGLGESDGVSEGRGHAAGTPGSVGPGPEAPAAHGDLGPLSGDSRATGETGGARAAVLPDQRARGRRSQPAASVRSSRERARGGGPAPGDPGLAEAVLEWAALARTDARERRDIAALAAAGAERRHAETAARLEDVREVARRQQRFAVARQRAEELADHAAEREEARGRLARARAASAVAPAVALRDGAASAHADAAAAETHARTRLARLADPGGPADPAGSPEPTGHPADGSADDLDPADGSADDPDPADRSADDPTDGPPPDPAAATAEQLAELEGAARQELGSLRSARRAERRTAEIDDELAAAERESREDEEIQRDAEEWLAGWEQRRLGHQQRIDAAQEAATRAEHLAGRLEPARARLTAARRRDALDGESEEAAAALRRAREAANAAHESWLALKERRLRGIAAELAAGLRAGEPCAVCGSPDHPEPARPDADHVDQAAEDAALADYRRTESAREAAERTAREAGEALAAVRAESGGEETGELAAQAERLAEEHAAAYAAGADVHPAREALDQAEREHERRLRRQQDAARRGAARTAHREDLQRERAALAEELERARGSAAGVGERAAALEERAARLGEAAAAARTARAAADRLADAEGQLADAARRARFDGPRDAAAAVLDEGELRALERRLERWQAEEAQVAAELDDPELTASAALPAADVEAAEAALEEATRVLRAASADDEAARTRCTELDRLSARAVADARALAPARRRHDHVARLAGLTAGTSAENARRMRLESYVLAARLEQVAAAASTRLSRMSAGRYTLAHTGERLGGRGRSGLGLRVVDAWTGAERDTATLSGGETFSASLALALGLADVVTEEAGGTRLETLFIDEGFGSLDEQTLDEVLDVLDSLRERDRCVGIVSHVADLRRRIPVQLEVAKARAGSRLRHRFAPVGG